MFKTELHIHTSPASACAKGTPESMVEDYIANGYSTIVITNHMSPTLFDVVAKYLDFKSAIDLFLDDYRRAKKAADGRINVLLGMELRVNENMNDYLVYGIDEQFIYDLGDVMDKRFRDVSPLIRESGALIYQAHPFRNGMTVTKPELIDGIEAINFCTTHDSRNDIAALWAKKFDMNTVYGSDYHSEKYMQGAGILTDFEIKTNAGLVRVLKNMDFKVTDGKKIIEI